MICALLAYTVTIQCGEFYHLTVEVTGSHRFSAVS
jgi:hypothetical protein